MHRVAVIGATGFAGQELIRLLARHPARHDYRRDRVAGDQHAAEAAGARANLGRRRCVPLDLERSSAQADVVFLALPEAASAELAPMLLDAGLRVIDLSGAFRLRDDAARAKLVPGDDGAAGRASPTA